jgi:hypothetical protein
MTKKVKIDKFGWGIWLDDAGCWAVLPPRLCKPTPHNSDLNPALIDVMRELIRDGHRPILRSMTARELEIVKSDHKEPQHV